MVTKYIPGRIDFSSKALNIPTINQCSEAVYVTGPHMGEAASNIDPWVKVGTTTIDGTVMQVATMLEASAWGPPVNDDEAEAHIDNFVRCGGPWLIGGRYLLPKGSHINGSLGTALIRCDIVRRQSEIDAEKAEQRADIPEVLRRLRASGYNISEPAPCPERGPHGNRGEVLLASSWAKCTTCAGGKPGDLWGEVKADKPTLRIWGVDVNANPSYEELRAAMSNHLKDFEIASGIRAPDGRSFMDARREALAAQHGQGFKVPTLSEMRGAALDDLRRHLESNAIAYDDDSIAKASRAIEERLSAYRATVPEPIKLRITES